MPKKKEVKQENFEMNGNCHYKYLLIKIAIVTFLLFLLTVWPWLNSVLLSVHWGWYLGITALLMILGGMKHCRCRK